MHTSLYTIYVKQPGSNKFLLVHGYTGAIDLVERHVAQFLREGGRLSEDDITTGRSPIKKETIEVLRKRGYLTERSPYEESELVKKFAGAMHKVNRKRCAFLFLVAYDCNFRCPYCYENDISNYGKGWSGKLLSKALIDRAYEAMLEIEADRNFHSDRITLYGGEPLLAQNYGIVSYIVKQGTDRGYMFSSITNGYDLHHFKDLLGPEKIEVLQITIDGMIDTHNKRRIHYLGITTFERILDNVDLALAFDATVCIRINTDLYNINELQPLSKIFKERGWTENPNFNSYSALVAGAGDKIKCNTVMSPKKSVHQENVSGYGCNISSGPNNTIAFVPLTEVKRPSSISLNGNEANPKNREIGLSESVASGVENQPETRGQSFYDPDAQYIDFEKEQKRFRAQNSNGEIRPLLIHSDVVELMPRARFVREYNKQVQQNNEVTAISLQDFGIKRMIKNALKNNTIMPFRSTYCSAQTGMYIFDPYGDLYTCWEMVGMDSYKVGSYTDKLSLSQDELNNWIGRTIATIPACSKCKYAFFCGGGCQAHAMREGRGPRSSFCDALPKVFHNAVAEAYREFNESHSAEKNEKFELDCR